MNGSHACVGAGFRLCLPSVNRVELAPHLVLLGDDSRYRGVVSIRLVARLARRTQAGEEVLNVRNGAVAACRDNLPDSS